MILAVLVCARYIYGAWMSDSFPRVIAVTFQPTCYYLQRNWPSVGPKLVDKLHVYVGGQLSSSVPSAGWRRG